MVDTEPLRRTMTAALGAGDGQLAGVRENLDRGRLKAVALTTTCYSTGQTVTFYSGRDIVGWERPQRRSVETALRVEHVMASAALPLFFPSIAIDGVHYGDGGIRLVAPLAPALHLGAEKILAISTRYGRTGDEADTPSFEGPPSPAQVMGVLFNAIFLDQLDQDALHMERINQLLETAPLEQREGLRPIELLVVRPSVDLGRLANEFEPQLPGMFRYLTRRLGTKQAKNQDFLSTVMFQHDYVRQLLELGERDGEARADEIADFVRP
jgi:NTE family protein